MALTPDQKLVLAREMAQRSAFDNMQLQKVHMHNKHKFANINRYMYNQRAEIDEEEKITNLNADTALKQAILQRDERLAYHMDQAKREESNEMRLRQQIRESAPELKELESKLRAAYINKILTAQMREKKDEKLREKMREKQNTDKLQQSRISEEEYRRQLQEEDIARKNKYRLELQDQMIFQETQRRFKYEEFLQEKKFIDELVQRIHEEDEREQWEKYCNMKRTQEEIQSFKAAQEIWKARTRKQIEEEDKKIKEFIKEKVELERKRRQSKAEKEAIKAKICDDMAKKIYQERRKVQEKQEIILELNVEEQKAAFDRNEKAKVEKELRQRIEVLSSLHNQMKEKREEEKREAERDAAYKDQLIAKIAEDNRIELMSQQKKKLKLMQIKKDVEQMIRDRRQKKAEEMQELLKMEELQKIEQEKRRQIIEQERIKLLQKHAKNLIGYLPPGVLRSDDIQYLGSDVAEKIDCRDR